MLAISWKKKLNWMWLQIQQVLRTPLWLFVCFFFLLLIPSQPFRERKAVMMSPFYVCSHWGSEKVKSPGSYFYKVPCSTKSSLLPPRPRPSPQHRAAEIPQHWNPSALKSLRVPPTLTDKWNLLPEQVGKLGSSKATKAKGEPSIPFLSWRLRMSWHEVNGK